MFSDIPFWPPKMAFLLGFQTSTSSRRGPFPMMIDDLVFVDPRHRPKNKKDPAKKIAGLLRNQIR